MMPDMEHADLIGVQEAAEIIGCSPRTVKRLAQTGALEVVHKLPGRTGAYLLDPDAVRAFAQQRAA